MGGGSSNIYQIIQKIHSASKLNKVMALILIVFDGNLKANPLNAATPPQANKVLISKVQIDGPTKGHLKKVFGGWGTLEGGQPLNSHHYALEETHDVNTIFLS